MASEVRNFPVTIPAGTQPAAPYLASLTMPAREVRGIRVRIPPGPRGSVGWALAAAGTPIIPWGAGQWMVADDEVIDWPLENQIDSGAWQVRAYNTGTHDHTLYFTFLVDPPGQRNGLALVAPLTITP